MFLNFDTIEGQSFTMENLTQNFKQLMIKNLVLSVFLKI